jgi:hypothetical protein
MYAAPTDETAKRLIDERGVTHIVVYLGDAFIDEYSRLARGGRVARRQRAAPLYDTFIRRALDPETRPSWLRMVPYEMPSLPGAGEGALILEVVRGEDGTL